MKKLLSIATFATLISVASAQTKLHPWGITLDANYKEYDGEFGNGFFKFKDPNIQPGIGISRYLNNWFDLGLNLNYGKFSHDPVSWTGLASSPTLNFKGLYASLNGRLKFNNGKWLKEEALFAPYLTAGIGYFNGKVQLPLANSSYSKTNAFNFPLGAGLRIQALPRLTLFLQSTWMPTLTDKLDLVRSGKHNDKLWEHKFGITYNFGKGKETYNNSKSKSNNGDNNKVSDADGDGIADNVDRCPNTPRGSKVDKFGCVVVDEAANKEIAGIIKNILFETNSSTLKNESHKELDRIAVIMNKFPAANLIVEGHTDNTGDEQTNLTLSQARADAVRNYLVGKSISQNRIMTKGYGSSMPIASNETAEGRSLNRRVELILTR